MRTNVMNSQNVRMVERRNRARFLFETPPSVGVVRQHFGQHFDGDIAPEPRVTRAVYLARSICAQRRNNSVGAEPDARG